MLFTQAGHVVVNKHIKKGPSPEKIHKYGHKKERKRNDGRYNHASDSNPVTNKKRAFKTLG